jgi:hypothetical protein
MVSGRMEGRNYFSRHQRYYSLKLDKIMMFDFNDFYERVADFLPNDCRICEVGVADMDSALFLAKRLHEIGKKFKMYAVDDLSYGNHLQIKTIYENIFKSGLYEYIEVVPKDSVTASKDFNNDYLDFVFLDSSHTYANTLLEIPAWYAKLKDDGVLAGHDFDSYPNDVGKAVKELLPAMITRNDIEGRVFEPEQFLFTEETDNNNGIWYVKKKFYYAVS